MTRVVPVGGFSGLMRRRYTSRHKLGILHRFGGLKAEEGLTMRLAAVCLGVSQSLLSKWDKLIDVGVPLLPQMDKKAVHDGRIGQFAPIEDKLL